MIQQITGHTGLCGLLGSPVSHSISPAMHNEAFQQLGLDYAYLAFDVDTENLKTAVDGLRVLGVRGFNVTMPCKNIITQYMDILTPAAELTGAVNTVINDNGVLTGTTTDGIGYMQAALDAGHDLRGKTMTLLGAGGAAISILVQAALDGVKEIHVFNIRDQFWARSEALVERLNRQTDCSVTLTDLNDTLALNERIAASDILTNGTSVGMAPRIENCPVKDFSAFRPELVVSDVIYNPRETMLLAKARELGCPTFNGMYMLLYQGAASFRLWTGQEMPVEMIKEKYFS